ncbi:DIE2/ALG10 family-domain-containing protein [Coniella lustricola]|uniref:Dol-P-Glc:Glc(2)Man(9)GlcNAc(2)-PP-Dol alpha-1,2-glucosyltransferase n=1 Tax=Coniella lustricola TaxID=2025994 RepID=A0A2T3ANB2_9PEZI|nr:DIE2/ALG10 family-domain-containing protein [Coniella lustricola]
MLWPSLLCVVLAGLFWQAAVNSWVPEPYLDEIFHIPQAQKYCQGRWSYWDDKITTPPGLYLISNAILRLTWLVTGGCSAQALRMTNWLAIAAMPLIAMKCRGLIEGLLAERQFEGGKRSPPSREPVLSTYAFHTGLNIALFPLLFFFSGLYYTDVYSTLVALAAYWNHLTRVSTNSAVTWKSDVLVVVFGVASLAMRQTNVFWVAAFMGGLEAVHAVKLLRPPPTSLGQSDRETKFKFYLWRYSQGSVHDPPLNKAGLEDVVLCVLSIAIAVCCNPFRVLRQIWAHVVVVILFVGFVFWNGGVVLGDKSNHIATIHLPQLLYIWPLFAFFSAPLILAWPIQRLANILGDNGSSNSNNNCTANSDPQDPCTGQQQAISGASWLSITMNLTGIAALVPLTLAIVRYNTIIHPFTLADNRHYMFYIFRYSILRADWVRYALVPVYITAGLLCWAVLGGVRQHSSGIDRPSITTTNSSSSSLSIKETLHTSNDYGTPTIQTASSHPADNKTSHLAPSLSTALIWFLTTALSLITAPLVEPRYFILPWVFWRLLTPSWSIPWRFLNGASLLKRTDSGDNNNKGINQKKGSDNKAAYDVRLFVETAWFILINIATMYIFITRPFYWKNPDGSLADGGQVQRFMW